MRKEYSYVTLSFRPTNNQTNGSILITFHGFDWVNKITLFPWSDCRKLYRNTNGDTCYVTVSDTGFNLTDAIFVSLQFIPFFNSQKSKESVDDQFDFEEPIYENIEDLIAEVCLISLEVEEFTGEKKKWFLYQGQNLRPNQIVTVTSSAFV